MGVEGARLRSGEGREGDEGVEEPYLGFGVAGAVGEEDCGRGGGRVGGGGGGEGGGKEAVSGGGVLGGEDAVV